MPGDHRLQQPITRAEIEEVRGVALAQSNITMLDRGQVVTQGRADTLGETVLRGHVTI
ncbi:SMC-Scp complex subunit ScpB [Lichenicola cladoniae]|uniref:SMC-Scp complex subunit ScpB n=1 Tax=Lichenicola cladoniae TaxID=1484109 RepID=UPI001EF48E36|nr:SMC-Scp complex subunit ScpB [Lichenicola cladoniae]